MAKTYNSIPTVATGDVYTAAAHNAIGDTIDNLRVPPMCRVTKSGTQSVANVTTTAITFTVEDYDTDEMHSTSVNTSRITIQTAGVYLVTGYVLTAPSAAPYNYTYILKNGATSNSLTTVMPGDPANARFGIVTASLSLAVNDYVELAYYQNSGGAINVTDQCWLSAVWLGQVS